MPLESFLLDEATTIPQSVQSLNKDGGGKICKKKTLTQLISSGLPGEKIISLTT